MMKPLFTGDRFGVAGRLAAREPGLRYGGVARWGSGLHFTLWAAFFDDTIPYVCKVNI